MSGHSNAPPSLAIPGADPRLYNHDLAPVAPEGRSWGVFSIFAMWMSDVHSVGGYTFAASLFFLGLTGWEVLLAMVAGITAVYFLMNLIGRPSLKYGTPFPVVARMSFGVMGANIAAGLRGIVGIVWYGVQTYLPRKPCKRWCWRFIPLRKLSPTTISSACPRSAGSASCSCGCSSF
jgi:NCS1 family nucleobase:cation symporter-1